MLFYLKQNKHKFVSIKMELLNNLEWYFHSEPKNACNKLTSKPLTNEEMDLIVVSKERMILILPLNDHYLLLESRELTKPITVKKVLETIYTFYQEPLKEDIANEAFKGSIDWMNEIIDTKYDGDISQLIKYDIFTDTCTPDFCGIEYDEEKNEYIVSIGPI